MNQQQVLHFNNFVQEQAKDLLHEIKRNKSTYGEVKKELKKLEVSANWGLSSSNFLIVISEATIQLENEIDAIIIK